MKREWVGHRPMQLSREEVDGSQKSSGFRLYVGLEGGKSWLRVAFS